MVKNSLYDVNGQGTWGNGKNSLHDVNELPGPMVKNSSYKSQTLHPYKPNTHYTLIFSLSTYIVHHSAVVNWLYVTRLHFARCSQVQIFHQLLCVKHDSIQNGLFP